MIVTQHKSFYWLIAFPGLVAINFDSNVRKAIVSIAFMLCVGNLLGLPTATGYVPWNTNFTIAFLHIRNKCAIRSPSLSAYTQYENRPRPPQPVPVRQLRSVSFNHKITICSHPSLYCHWLHTVNTTEREIVFDQLRQGHLHELAMQ